MSRRSPHPEASDSPIPGVILGWLLGILITALFRWRTRAPRPS
jgi:hypothetical protein